MNQRITVNAVCIISIMLACCLVVGCASMEPRQDDEIYIREGARQWADSLQTGDTTALERILADDFLGTDPKGNFYTKASMLSYIKTAPQDYVSNRLNDIKIRQYGDMAVAHGSESWTRRDGGQGRFVWTDTWLKRNRRWQIVAAQDVIVREKSASQNADETNLRSEVEKADKRMWKAAIDVDIAALEQIIADDFIGVYDDDGDGNDPVVSKERFISQLETGEVKILSYKYDEINIQIDDNIAAISGLVTMSEYYQGEDVTGQRRFTSTWIKRSDGWKFLGDNYVRIN